MRKVILFVNTTLDGFMGGPNGELDWMVLDNEMDREFTADLRRTVDTILSGRATYQSFEQFWPARAEDPASPEDLVDFANWMLDTPKVVFSNSLDKVEMKNSRLAEADIAEEVANLKRQPGGDSAEDWRCSATSRRRPGSRSSRARPTAQGSSESTSSR